MDVSAIINPIVTAIRGIGASCFDAANKLNIVIIASAEKIAAACQQSQKHDINGLREIILANSSYLWRVRGPGRVKAYSPNLELVVVSRGKSLAAKILYDDEPGQRFCIFIQGVPAPTLEEAMENLLATTTTMLEESWKGGCFVQNGMVMQRNEHGMWYAPAPAAAAAVEE